MSLAVLSRTGMVAFVIMPSWQSGIASRVAKSCLQPVSISQERMSDLGMSSVSSDAGRAIPADSAVKAHLPSQMETAAAAVSTAGTDLLFIFLLLSLIAFLTLPWAGVRIFALFPELAIPHVGNLHGVFGVVPFPMVVGAP